MGNGIGNDGRVGLNFEFKMPGNVELDLGPGFRERYGFEQRKGGVLPSSYSTTNFPQIVEYYLEGLLYNKSKLYEDHTVRQTLLYRPPSTLVEELIPGGYIPTTSYLGMRGTRCQTHRLRPEWDPNEGVFRRWKYERKKNNKDTPHATFRILARVPETALIGSVIPIELSLEHLDCSPEVEQPTIFLRKIRVAITSVLQIRVPQNSVITRIDSSNAQEEERDLFVREFQLGKGGILYDGLKLTDLGMGRLDKVVPGFSSYGMYLWWKIEVKVSVECANEKFDDIGVCKGPITFLSGMRSYDNMEPETSVTSEEEDLPPPYESALSSN